MAAATSKRDLIAVCEKEYEKLEKLLESVSARQAAKKHEDNTSIKDVVAHRAHWITLFLGWYKDGLAGKEVYFPAKGYKWSELKAYNQQLRLDQSAMTWKEAVSLLTTNHKKLLKFMRACSEADLYGHPMKGANNHWTAGRWAEAAGPSHYRSAAKFVRACLKASG